MTTDNEGGGRRYAVEPEPVWLPGLLALHPLLADTDVKTVEDWHRPPFRDPTWEPLDEEAENRLREEQLANPISTYMRVVALARVLVGCWDRFDNDARRRIFDYVEDVLVAGQETGDEQDVLHMKMSMLETIDNLAKQTGETLVRDMRQHLGPESKKIVLGFDAISDNADGAPTRKQP